MKALLAPLAELADYEEIRKNRTKENGMIQISGCVNTQKIHLLSGIGSGCGYKLVVFSNEEKAKKAYEEYLLFGEETYLYPARDLLFYYADIKGCLPFYIRIIKKQISCRIQIRLFSKQ